MLSPPQAIIISKKMIKWQRRKYWRIRWWSRKKNIDQRDQRIIPIIISCSQHCLSLNMVLPNSFFARSRYSDSNSEDIYYRYIQDFFVRNMGKLKASDIPYVKYYLKCVAMMIYVHDVTVTHTMAKWYKHCKNFLSIDISFQLHMSNNIISTPMNLKFMMIKK